MASRPQKALGQASVETALLFPFLILVVLGIADFGRVYFTRVQLENAVSEGARYAAFNRNETAVKTKTREHAGTLAITDSDITVQCFSGSSSTTKTCTFAIAGTDSIGVTATLAFQPITPLVGSIIGSAVTVSSNSRRTLQ